MRNLTPIMQSNINKHIQTEAESSAPASYVQIHRNTIPLTQSRFIERTKVATMSGMTDSDIAVCHPKAKRSDSEVWIASVHNGKLSVKYAETRELVRKMNWKDYGIDYDAECCAIAFQSRLVDTVRGIQELVTEEYPWVFWAHNGELKAQYLDGVSEPIVLAEANVTDVTVARGPADASGLWDFGLCTFFIASGKIIYRQLINNTWYDGVLFEPEGITNISKISAFNTWDYRIGLQILTTDKNLYELFSYTEGIGVRGSEHISIEANVISSSKLITMDNKYHNDNISISARAMSEVLWGLPPEPVKAYNIKDASGDLGKIVVIDMDYYCVGGNASEWKMTDANGTIYYPLDYAVKDKQITLTFGNFNNAPAGEELVVEHTKGSLKSIHDVTANNFTIAFVPKGLSYDEPPMLLSITNNDLGTEIYLEYTKSLTTGVEESKDAFTVKYQEYDMVPDKGIVDVSRTPSAISVKEDDDTILVLRFVPSFTSTISNIEVSYSSDGRIEGEAGPIETFTESFTPTELTWKGNHNDRNHIFISATVDGKLKSIIETDTNTPENISIKAEVYSVVARDKDV